MTYTGAREHLPAGRVTLRDICKEQTFLPISLQNSNGTASRLTDPFHVFKILTISRLVLRGRSTPERYWKYFQGFPALTRYSKHAYVEFIISWPPQTTAGLS